MITDFHSHILPGIDDGSRSVEESAAMLRLSAAQGIRRIVATPHFYPQHTTPQRFLEKRRDAYERLMAHIGDESGLPDIALGAEVYYYPHMSHSQELQQLAIEGTRFILVELPASPWTDRMYRELEALHDDLGLTPIVAHVDRYLGRLRDYGIPKRLSQLPVLVQANASFFQNRTDKALKMLQNRQIHLLGSDCHNLTDRSPDLGPAVELIRQRLGEDAIEWLLRTEQEVFPAWKGKGP